MCTVYAAGDDVAGAEVDENEVEEGVFMNPDWYPNQSPRLRFYNLHTAVVLKPPYHPMA